MTIDRLNPLEKIQLQKTTGTQNVSRKSEADSVSLSAEAVQKAEIYNITELAKSAPDIRMDKIAEIKAKIDDPHYIDDVVLNATADQILDQLL